MKNYFVKCIGYKGREKFFTIGKVYEVKNNTLTNDNGFTYNRTGSIEDIVRWLSDWYTFEVVTYTPKIVITTDGVKVTTAKMYENGKVVKTAEAKCAPEDTFDFMVGAKLACERLNKPTYYNGKVVCIKSGYPHWTVGKVYEVKDGIIVNNDGMIHPRFNCEPYRDAEDVRHAGSVPYKDKRHNELNEFVPLVEN